MVKFSLGLICDDGVLCGTGIIFGLGLDGRECGEHVEVGEGWH